MQDQPNYATNPEYFGYYDEPTQSEPTYDPWNKAPCLICGNRMDDDDVRTISLIPAETDPQPRIWFYRVHRTCHVQLTADEQAALSHRLSDYLLL
jgi:hypothetical protein